MPETSVLAPALVCCAHDVADAKAKLQSRNRPIWALFDRGCFRIGSCAPFRDYLPVEAYLRPVHAIVSFDEGNLLPNIGLITNVSDR
jgi:hypothetical protein